MGRVRLEDLRNCESETYVLFPKELGSDKVVAWPELALEAGDRGL